MYFKSLPLIIFIIISILMFLLTPRYTKLIILTGLIILRNGKVFRFHGNIAGIIRLGGLYGSLFDKLKHGQKSDNNINFIFLSPTKSLKLIFNPEVILFKRLSIISSMLIIFLTIASGTNSFLGNSETTLFMAFNKLLKLPSLLGAKTGSIILRPLGNKEMFRPNLSLTITPKSLAILYKRNLACRSSIFPFSSSVISRFGRSDLDFIRIKVEATKIKLATSPLGKSVRVFMWLIKSSATLAKEISFIKSFLFSIRESRSGKRALKNVGFYAVRQSHADF